MEARGVTLKSSVSESHKYPDIVTLNETNMKSTMKINLKKYVLFCKKTKKNSHGISTSFDGYLKDSSVKVSQDQGGVDEFRGTRLENVEPALNVINIYRVIEERESKEDILESWTQIKKELNKIQERGKAVINSHWGPELGCRERQQRRGEQQEQDQLRGHFSEGPHQQ